MKKRLYISCIKNIQDDYAEIMKFILGQESRIVKNTFQIETEETINARLIHKIVDAINVNLEDDGVYSMPDLENNNINLNKATIYQNDIENVYYMVYVICNDIKKESMEYVEDDVVNLQYFTLMRQALNNMENTKNINIILFVRPSYSKENQYGEQYNTLYYKVSQFMSNETTKHKNCHYAFKWGKNNWTLVELTNAQKGIWRKFSPLMEISNYKDIELWSRTLDDIDKDWHVIFTRADLDNIFSMIYYSNAGNNILTDKEDAYYEKNRYYRVLKICKAYFCEIPPVQGRKKRKDTKTKAEMTETLIKKFDNELFGEVKDMPLLAFYIMCLFIYFTRTSNTTDYGEISSDDIYKWKFTANDIADGLLQLMENIVSHSQFGKGFFALRIHTNKDKNGYLHTKYKKYFENIKLEKPFYFEIQIIDFSEFGILDKYVKDICKKDESLANKVDKFPLKSLFSPSDEECEFFRVYDRIEDNNLIHHYGLQLFFSMIESGSGCFVVKSSASDDIRERSIYSNFDVTVSDNAYLPGTQYSVLLPFEYEEKQYATSLNANINYVDYLEEEFEVVDLGMQFNKKTFLSYLDEIEQNNSGMKWQQKKEKAIDSMAVETIKLFERKVRNTDYNSSKIYILSFDADEIELGCIEYFCKICIYIGIYKKTLREIPIAIRNCSENHFLSIVRMFSVFYDKQGNTDIMKKMQIYLVGQDAGEEFIITGKNIRTAISSAQKLAFTRGVNGKYLKLLTQMLKRRNVKYEVEDVKFIPFDLEICYNDGKTPFERGVSCVLEREIGEDLFGCKILDAHMRLGSKIHIKDFYEAELLFNNNYYTSGFAYQIIKQIDRDGIDFNKPIMIVGYETYSEMFLYEIANLMKKRCEYKKIEYKDIDYMYFENKENTFRIFNNKNMSEIESDTQYIVIVPINSTLTTHDKLIALIKNNVLGGESPKIIEKIAIVLIRDSGKKVKNGLSILESEFWDKIVEKKELVGNKKGLPSIYTKKLSGTEGHHIKYLISLETEWLDPLKCRYCFPNKKYNMYYTDELPLIETNKASVVPIQKIGLKNSQQFVKISYDDGSMNKNNGRIHELADFLIYKHISRNNNHYSYYFETEKFMKANKENIGNWLENECKCVIKKEECLVYDILVAPLHYSNTAFVEEVNMRVFKGASLVLHFDVEKEYRGNIRTKFSNIKVLYDNLINSNQKAIIRFHYVDDTIVSGNTFYRMKSVIKSIFTRENIEADSKETKVEIDIFYSIFLLLNRCSTITKYNYIDDLQYYFSYVDLFISSMRNHEDACVLCKSINEYNNLKKGSATNALIRYWNAEIDKHKIHKLPADSDKEFYNNREGEYKYEESEQKERAKRRMICSHMASIKIDGNHGDVLKEEDEVNRIKRVIVNDLLFDDSISDDERFEYIISYIKILSRPFFVFARNEKNAIFSLMLEMIDYILFANQSLELGNPIEKERPDLKKWLESFCIENLTIIKGNENRKRQAYILLITLMKRLSGLGSTYVVRKRNVGQILFYFKEISAEDKSLYDKFIRRYLAMVKRNISLSNDEMKSIYLEYMILYGEEYTDESLEEIKDILDDKIFRYFFLENNRVIIDAATDLKKDILSKKLRLTDLQEQDLIDILNEYYYYLNFKRLLCYYKMCKIEDKIEYKISGFGEKFSVIKAFMLLEKELSEKNNNQDVVERYNIIREYVCGITGADSVNIYVTDGQNPLIYGAPINGKKEVEAYKLVGNESERFHPKVKIKIPQTEAELNTYVIDNNGQDTLVTISTSDNISNTHIISFMLEFSNKESSDIYIGLKLFLVFWHKMLDYTENDLKNNLIEKWKSAQEFQYQITKSRAKDHTDDDALHIALLDLRNKYRDRMPDAEEVTKMLILIVNMYIARLNTRALIFENQGHLIKGEIIQKTIGKSHFSDLYDNYLKSMLMILRKKDNFELYYEGGKDNNEREELPESLMKKTIRYIVEDGVSKYPPLHHLAIIIIECILSAIKYGSKDENGKVSVGVIHEGHYLYIKSGLMENEDAETINKKIKAALQRETDGISLVTISRYFIDFYGSDEVSIDAIETNEEKYFKIGLPIIKVKEEK